MSNENKSIHDFDFQLICEYFSALDRQGPGSPEATINALGFTGNYTAESQVADIGCGTGGQTTVLAQHIPAQITGIDLFPTFIELFNAYAISLNMHQRLKGITGNMNDLPFQNETLDLIWSEGAIYNVGFERGLKEWKQFLKPGGHIAVTEATWFTDERPAEISAFWQDAYPGIDTIPRKIAQMQQIGYIPVAHFILPETCWTDHFYKPQEKIQQDFLRKNKGNQTAEALVANQRHEAQLYAKYKDYYGYVFYIGKKPAL
ncbi:MAG: class I SAM-dependent methyltransferase [Lentimicrobium sp.]|nr:class I SAM-dependent methyltransferase [Lentimicrobium sp.]